MNRFFFLLIALTATTRAYSYEDAIHFYSTFTLAALCGFDRVQDWEGKSEAVKIAWSDWSVDQFPESSPGENPWDWFTLEKVHDRRLYHFPIDEGATVVTPGSFASLRILNYAIQEAERDPTQADSVLFGIGLHVYQDTWAHQGYDAVFGHLFAGTAPDYPDRHPEAADEMIASSWEILDRWNRTINGEHCLLSKEGAMSIFSIWNRYRPRNENDLEHFWRARSEEVTSRMITHDDSRYNDSWDEDFHAATYKLETLFDTEH